MARHARIQGDESKNSMIDEAGKITTEMDVKFWLGDEEGDLKVYRTRNTKRDVLLTLATGIDKIFIYTIFSKMFFSRESDSTFTNVRNSVCL